jgi:hypothetical protein
VFLGQVRVDELREESVDGCPDAWVLFVSGLLFKCAREAREAREGMGL